VITLTTGNKMVIREGLDELADKVIAFKHAVRAGLSLREDRTNG
jgi:uncharacterized protein YlzI (FlbEa/FlbD family)